MINKLILSLVSFTLSFLIIDHLLYLFYPRFCTLIQPDYLLNHKLIPNHKCLAKTFEFTVEYSINNLGLRESETVAEAKPEELYRILFLGDSFTFGTGVAQKDTLVKQIERLQNAKFSSRKIQTINSGVLGYSTVLENLYLRTKGTRLNPDMVIVNLNMTDFSEDRLYLKNPQFPADFHKN